VNNQILNACEGTNRICRRYCYQSYWPLSPRDVVVCTSWKTLPDGRILLCTSSLPNDWAPPTPSHVRATVLFSGSLLRAIDEHSTEVTMMNHSHLDTTFPASIVNSAAMAIPVSFVQHYRRFLSDKSAQLQSRIHNPAVSV
jgi:hypothetical protein